MVRHDTVEEIRVIGRMSVGTAIVRGVAGEIAGEHLCMRFALSGTYRTAMRPPDSLVVVEMAPDNGTRAGCCSNEYCSAVLVGLVADERAVRDSRPAIQGTASTVVLRCQSAISRADILDELAISNRALASVYEDCTASRH